MRSLLFLFVLLMTASIVRAQNCDNYITKGAKFIEDNWPEPHAGAIYTGRTISIPLPPDDAPHSAGPDSFFIWPVLKGDMLYLTGMHAILSGGYREPSNSCYVFEFVDGTKYRYTEPYFSAYSMSDFFVLLKGTVAVADTPHYAPRLPDAHGDSALLMKMRTTPLRSIQSFLIRDNYRGDLDGDGKRFSNPIAGDKMVIFIEEAKNFIRSLRCLTEKMKEP